MKKKKYYAQIYKISSNFDFNSFQKSSLRVFLGWKNRNGDKIKCQKCIEKHIKRFKIHNSLKQKNPVLTGFS